MSAAALIEARDLNVHFRQHRTIARAVDGVSFEWRRGEILGVVGESGCGKSTLARALLGLIPPTAGSVEVLGHDLATEAGAGRSVVGYSPEHDCLPPDVSASDLVVHLAMMSGLPRVAARERAADKIISRAGGPAATTAGGFGLGFQGLWTAR